MFLNLAGYTPQIFEKYLFYNINRIIFATENKTVFTSRHIFEEHSLYYKPIMKEQNITEKESLDIITSMIEGTKQRLHMGDGNIFLMWGWLTIAVSVLVGTLLYFTHSPAVNWLWFLIWIIGGTLTPFMSRKKEAMQGMVLNEKSLIAGGVIGFVSGIVMMGFMLAHFPLTMTWVLPLFITGWVCMMIIPGYSLNAKARKNS